ncbi:TonB-dependent siderophore receptor [Psychromonas sp. MB-3u-54]|uniref:TonB-dependent receptor family protein n=1 Tax=Psychromonas sp. MB-3u-54 TaxID=2058319 RepID=UPI000C32BBF4|nr:TonB-dependent siderophore receptor [Psychromonas sp. MB-3u-54]PKH01458.1 TonB-dependent siderophore receptor [Psychromonas sp. MB-3u-54]
MNTNSPRFKRKALSLAVVTGLISNYAQAAEPEQIEKMVVTASVLGNSEVAEIRTYEGNRSIMTSEVLKKTSARSIDTALQQIPGIKISDETGTGVLPNVSVRGLDGSRSGYSQFLLDGIPMTLAPYGHTGQSLFPASLEMIDRIDVVRGGAAVQYGPNNVGGVINLVSKPIPEQWKTSLNERMTFFGDNTLYDTYLSTGGRVNKNVAVRFSANFLSGESFRDHSDTDVQNWMVQTDWKINDNQSLETTVQYYDAETELPGALNTEAYKEDSTQSLRPNDEFAADTTRVSMKYNHLLGDIGIADYAEFDIISFVNQSKRNFAWDYYDASEDTDGDVSASWADTRQDATDLRSSPREFTVYGIEPRATLYIDGPVSQDWIVGVRYVNEDISYQLKQTDNNSGETASIRNWHMGTNAMAYYASNKLGFFNDSLTVTPGLRYEDVRMTFTNLGGGYEQNNNVREILPGLTLGYEFSDRWFSYANAQKSLRTPQISQLWPEEQKLDSEISWNYETGVRFTPTQNTNLNIALYRIDFKNKIQYDSDQSEFVNIGETRSQGVEVEGQFSPQAIPELTLRGAYNYLDTEQLDGEFSGNELPNASKHQISASALYDYRGVDLGLMAYYYSKSFSDLGNTTEENSTGTVGQLPAYTVVNFTVSTELYNKETQSLTVALGVNNLLDNEYYFRGLDVSPAGRVAAPGRSFTLDLGYDF